MHTYLKSTYIFIMHDKNVQEGNDQEMAQSERNTHSKNRGWEKN